MSVIAAFGRNVPGVHPHIANDDYHAHRSLSHSLMERLRISPAHMQSYFTTPHETTEALTIGDALHAMALEPVRFKQEYIVAPMCMAHKKNGEPCSHSATGCYGGTAWLCGVHKPKGAPPDASKATVLTETQMKRVRGMCNAMTCSQAAWGTIKLSRESGNLVEASVLGEINGALCRCRPDLLVAGKILVDIKSTGKPAVEFESAIFNFGYHRQFAHYAAVLASAGVVIEDTVLIVVESDPPHGVRTLVLSKEAIDAGAHENLPLYSQYAECIRTDNWPGYPDEAEMIGLPEWAYRRIYQSDIV
jgi:hypothetical protein